MQTMVIPINLTIDQLLEGFKQLSQGDRAVVIDSLEDYFLGQAMAITLDEPMYSRDEALRIVEQFERRADVAG